MTDSPSYRSPSKQYTLKDAQENLYKIYNWLLMYFPRYSASHRRGLLQLIRQVDMEMQVVQRVVAIHICYRYYVKGL